MRHFYSFVLFLPEGEFPLPEAGILLERGLNCFNALIDAETLPALRNKITSSGARILKINDLEDHEPVDARSLLDVALRPDELRLLGEGIKADLVVPSEAGPSGARGGDIPLDRDEPTGFIGPTRGTGRT